MYDISKTPGGKPFKIGFLVGKDFVGADNAAKYPHNRKTWIAFQIGFVFGENKVVRPTTKWYANRLDGREHCPTEMPCGSWDLQQPAPQVHLSALLTAQRGAAPAENTCMTLIGQEAGTHDRPV